MRLEVECTEVPPPQVMNVLIDRSRSNSKCVAVSEPVTCDVDAGNLGKRINSHGARDTLKSQLMVLKFVPNAQIDLVTDGV